MDEYPLSVHGGVFYFPSIVSSVWKYYHSLIIVSVSILKFALIIGAVLKDSDSEAIWKFFFVEISLIISLFGGDIEEGLPFDINFLVGVKL